MIQHTYNIEPITNFTYTEGKNWKRRRQIQVYYQKQKILGAICLMISIIAPFFAEGGIAATFFLLPIGIMSLFTKEKIFTID